MKAPTLDDLERSDLGRSVVRVNALLRPMIEELRYYIVKTGGDLGFEIPDEESLNQLLAVFNFSIALSLAKLDARQLVTECQEYAGFFNARIDDDEKAAPTTDEPPELSDN